jgi:outer membrane lipoprotein SlyB
MKPSFLLGAVVGYILGSKAGRGRYEEIVAIGRRVAGSQTVQATAGVLQAQTHEVTERARRKLTRRDAGLTPAKIGANGHHRTN